MVHRRPAFADLDAPELSRGGELARKPQRAHDERSVEALVCQDGMPCDIESAREDPPHPDPADYRAGLEGEDRCEPEHHANPDEHPLRNAPAVERAHDRRRREREKGTSRRERRDHVEDAHEEDAIEAREGQEAQTADRGEAHARLDGKLRPAVRREVNRRERLQEGRLDQPGDQHGGNAHGEEGRKMRPGVESEDPRLYPRLFRPAHAIFALRTCFFRNLEPMSPPTTVPATNIAIMSRIQGSSVYWATIAATSAAS